MKKTVGLSDTAVLDVNSIYLFGIGASHGSCWTLGEDAEILVTVVLAVLAVITHHVVGHALPAILAREGGRK